MAYFTDMENANWVLQFEQNRSTTSVQWWFSMNYGKEAHTRKSIYKWHKSFAETGCICANNNSVTWLRDKTVGRVWCNVSL
jgi:hypothetical protein